MVAAFQRAVLCGGKRLGERLGAVVKKPSLLLPTITRVGALEAAHRLPGNGLPS